MSNARTRGEECGRGGATAEFTIAPDTLEHIGAGLSRPECVLTTLAGDLYISDDRGGVSLLRADGSRRLFSGSTLDGGDLSANGFALQADGSFLIAPLSGGGVFKLTRNGQASPWLMNVDGLSVESPNFVLLDREDRIWICCLAKGHRKTLSPYSRDRRDGFIVLVDNFGARIVADGIGYPNEVRIDPTGRYLYTNETLAARLLRYPILPGGALGAAEVIAAFDETNLFDGFTLDAEGGAWITALVSNRLWHVSREGTPRLLLEDAAPELMVLLVERLAGGALDRSLLYDGRVSKLGNISSVAFGGADLQTVFLGSLMGKSLLRFKAPVAGIEPAHWRFGPFPEECNVTAAAATPLALKN